jgi:hypothetical protein
MMKKILIIFGLIIVLVLVAFADKNIQENRPATTNEEPEETLLETLVVKHQYKDGKHIFVGEVELPRPCLAYSASIVDTDNEKEKEILLSFSDPEGEPVCDESFRNAPYRVTYIGPEDLTFKAFVGGQEYRLNAFEIPLDQNIDDFEIFMKG